LAILEICDIYQVMFPAIMPWPMTVLLRFELFFDGTLGDWNLLPVSFELKEGMKPYHSRPYPIPHKYKTILMKEIKWLSDIGVLDWQPTLQ
jgi:hypothetical protein